MSRPTLRDVAAKAGLSITQVSRALNDHDDVAESTKELARRVAAELQYTPNLEARRLKDPGARRGAIGIILPHDSLRFSDPFFGEMLTSMATEASASGLQLALSTHPDGSSVTDPYEQAIREQQVDGFIILRTTVTDPRVDFLLKKQTPFVAFGRPAGREDIAAVEVATDCFDPVVEHLRSLGHERVACIAEPSRFAVGTARLAAFMGAAERGGLVVPDSSIIESGFHEGSGQQSAEQLLRSPTERPTAIVAMNDLLALGALQAADAVGLKVPTDLTVIGFDDIQAARQVEPPLTTVRQSPVDVGSALVQLLRETIEAGNPTPAHRRIDTELIIRESSADSAD